MAAALDLRVGFFAARRERAGDGCRRADPGKAGARAGAPPRREWNRDHRHGRLAPSRASAGSAHRGARASGAAGAASCRLAGGRSRDPAPGQGSVAGDRRLALRRAGGGARDAESRRTWLKMTTRKARIRMSQAISVDSLMDTKPLSPIQIERQLSELDRQKQTLLTGYLPEPGGQPPPGA
ncbi:MAG: hypothetical protein MZV64_10165 [Ignavibacteriales bacterium]|nr:hypothetical protein [Ignavibacteriales bacterium]